MCAWIKRFRLNKNLFFLQAEEAEQIGKSGRNVEMDMDSSMKSHVATAFE